MFGFLTPGTKESIDPLTSPKAVSAWLRQLPALDVIGRQQQVMRAFEAMKASRKPCDISRVQAIEYLDASPSKVAAKEYIQNTLVPQFGWELQSNNCQLFMELVERRFSF